MAHKTRSTARRSSNRRGGQYCTKRNRCLAPHGGSRKRRGGQYCYNGKCYNPIT
jgi:hypothetical protein